MKYDVESLFIYFDEFFFDLGHNRASSFWKIKIFNYSTFFFIY